MVPALWKHLTTTTIDPNYAYHYTDRRDSGQATGYQVAWVTPSLQCAPPSTGRFTPVTYLAAGDDSHSTASATSSDCTIYSGSMCMPRRPAIIASRERSASAGSRLLYQSLLIMGVSTPVGHTAFALIQCGP